MMVKELRLWLAVLVPLAGCASTADAGQGVLQYVPPPCDVPGLSQEQYRTCVGHMWCESLAMGKITLGERKWNDPRVDEEYKQCLRKGDWDPGPGWYWVIKP
jgi:hypothetical protein